jgi:hypothetical protein
VARQLDADPEALRDRARGVFARMLDGLLAARPEAPEVR